MKYSIILPSFFNAAFNLLHLLQHLREEEEEEEEEEAGLELKPDDGGECEWEGEMWGAPAGLSWQ